MAITLNTTGELNPNTVNAEKKSVYSYSYCSSVITTTDNYADNVMVFGVSLQEIHIVNGGNKAICFQFEDHEGTSKDSGIVLANTETVIRKAYKSKIKIRSADAGMSSTVYVFGI